MLPIISHVAEISLSYKPSVAPNIKISSSQIAYNTVIQFFNAETIQLQEEFIVMYLNNSNKILGVCKHSLGGITGTVADMRIILATALKAAATGIILAHNHPSGNTVPSNADKEITEKIKQAACMLEIKLIDHLIIGIDGNYCSFSDNGWL